MKLLKFSLVVFALTLLRVTSYMNVLFFLFDDLRVTHGTWGFEQSYTPRTDALANRSLIFDNAYVQQAVCGPSRASFLSGRRPDTTQMWNFVGSFRDTPGADKWNTWPEWFKNHGYNTQGYGKLFHPDDPENFDPQSWTGNKYGGFYGYDRCPYTPESPGMLGWVSVNCSIPESMTHTFPDVEALDSAKAFLDGVAADSNKQPFWLGVGFVRPHLPHVYPEKYLNVIPSQEDITLAKHQLPPTGNASRLNWESGSRSHGPSDIKYQTPAPVEEQQLWKHSYYASVAFSDDLLGQLVDYLEEKKLSENTLIVMTSDHGWGLGEHNHFEKYTTWETDARVPLLIHHPTATHTWNVHTKSLVELVDMYPTLAELAGIPVTAKDNESIEGYSFATLFAEGADPANEVWTNAYNASFTQYPRCGENITSEGLPTFQNPVRCATENNTDVVFMGYSMRTERWRYTEWAEWDGVHLKPVWAKDVTTANSLVELYDHEGDSLAQGAVGQKTWDDFENVNVAAENEDVVKSLSARVRAFYDTSSARRGQAYGSY